MLGSYLLRLSLVTARTAGRRTLGVLEEVRVPLRIWPTDLDVYLHLNNGRCLTLMDFGRLAHGLRTGLARKTLQRRWRPVVGSAEVHFRRELRVLQRVDLVTRLVFWDEKWIFFEHRLEQGDEQFAVATVKAVVKERGKTVAPSEVVAAVGHHGPPPEPPARLLGWHGLSPSR
jgi:acyl-CoA thioesterase FadM